jgi:Rieske Fe-S protein
LDRDGSEFWIENGAINAGRWKAGSWKLELLFKEKQRQGKGLTTDAIAANITLCSHDGCSPALSTLDRYHRYVLETVN